MTKGIKAMLTGLASMMYIFTNAQPLQFLYEKDSLRLLDVDVEATSDGGWICTGAGLDSSITLMKFDHCGKLQWQEKIIQSSTRFSQLHIVINNDVLYLAAAAFNGNNDPIYVLKYNLDQSLKEEAWLNLQRVNNKQHPSIAVAASGRVEVGFSGGDDPANLNGYIFHLDNGLNILGSDVYNGQSVASLEYKETDEFIATLGQNVIIQYNASGLQWSRFIRNHQHLQRNILFSSDNDIIVLGRDMSSASPGLRLIKFDRAGRIVQIPQPSIVPYVPSFPTKLIEGENEFWVVYESKKDTLKAIAYTSFSKNLKWNGTNLYVMNRSKDSIQSAGISYLERENNFAATAANMDSLSFFYAKANNKFSFSCKNEEDHVPSILDRFVESDTIRLNITATQGSGMKDNVETLAFNVEFKEARCYKFELKDGNIPYPPACKGDRVVFTAGPDNPFYTFQWSDGQKGNSIEVIAPAEASVVITYCEKSVTITHKVELINLDRTVLYPNTCIDKDTFFTAFYLGDKFKYSWENGSSEKKIDIKVPKTLKATVTCNESSGIETHVIGGVSIDKNDTLKRYEFDCDANVIAFKVPDNLRGFDFIWEDGSFDTLKTLNKPQRALTLIISCDNTILRQLHIAPCLEVELPNVFFPGSTVPDNKVYDPIIKDTLTILEYEIKIFNRWGQMVFESKDRTKGWDGNYNGEPAPTETYSVYVRTKRIIFGDIITKGPLTLIR